MEPDDYIEDHDDDIPDFRDPEEIDTMELGRALGSLHLVGDDPFLRIQAFNLSLVDHFIMGLELQLHRARFNEEKELAGNTAFLSAQTQMWIFAVYELLRTWRARAKDIVKLAKNGGLQLKVDSLTRKLSFEHPARQMRADQLRRIIKKPALLDDITRDLRRTHILFSQLEHVRVALAKHEVGGKKNSVAHAPGLALFNRWNGSLEYEIAYEGAILGTLSRRDIAESLRALADASNSPSAEDLASFDEFMKGPPPDDLWT
ncbi:MAG: hypothetical protein AB7O50_15275 [Pseudolabrys sp.]